MNIVRRKTVDTLKVLVHELLASEMVAVRTRHALVSATRPGALLDVPLVHHLQALTALDAGGTVGTEMLGGSESMIALLAVVL